MKYRIFFMIFLPYLLNIALASTHLDLQHSYSEGQRQYYNAVSKTSLPNFGSCWKNALHRLEKGCKSLTNTVTHLLAYDFTRCFYLELGNTLPICDGDLEIGGCKTHLKPEMINGPYALFFTHVRDMCIFLENQVWQERTEETVEDLSRTSRTVVDKLQDADRLQQKIAASQSETLNKQEILLKESSSLAEIIQASQSSVVETLNQFQSSYNKQMIFFTQLFDKISILEEIFLAQYTGTQAVLIWTLSLVVCYLVTSTKSTQPARLSLLLITLSCAALELLCISGMLCPSLCSFLQSYNQSPTMCVYECTKVWRWFYAAAAIFIFIYALFTYEDYDSKIYNAITDLQKDINSLKNTYGIQPGLAMASNSDEVCSDGVTNLPIEVLPTANGQVHQEIIPDESVADDTKTKDRDDGNDSDDLSGLDSESDTTFRMSHSEMSTISSNHSESSALSELSSEELSYLIQNGDGSSPCIKENLETRAMTSDGRNVTPCKKYNLRSRKSTSTNNAGLLRETERQFTKLMENLSKHRQPPC